MQIENEAWGKISPITLGRGTDSNLKQSVFAYTIKADGIIMRGYSTNGVASSFFPEVN